MSATFTPCRRRYRRTLLSILVGLVLLDLGVYLTRATWDRYSPNDYRDRVQTCRSRPRDLIVVGGSPVSEGIDPSHFLGMVHRGQAIDSVYSLGLPGATTTDCWHALQQGCPSPPRVLLYGITASDLNDARNCPEGPAELMTGSDLVDWIAHRPDSAAWATRQFLRARLERGWQFFDHRHGIRLWLADQLEEWSPGSFPETLAAARHNLAHGAALRSETGYAPNSVSVQRRYDHMKRDGFCQTTFLFLERYRLGEHWRYLDRMRHWAEHHDAELILVDMPITEDLECLYPEEFRRYREALRAWARDQGVRVLWASRATLELSDRQFSDLIHLNAEGTRQLSGWIRAQLDDSPVAVVTPPAEPS